MAVRNIFISYAREDRAPVDALALALNAFDSSFYCYYDAKNLAGDWWPQLLDKIERCDTFMPVLSQHYASSTPCQTEAAYASDLRRAFVPVALEDVGFVTLHPSIRDAQSFPFIRSNDDLVRLVNGLLALPPPPPLPVPMPDRPAVPANSLYALTVRVHAASELTFHEQWQLLADLRSRYQPADLDVRWLLEQLRARPETSNQVTTEIANLLGSRPPDVRVAATQPSMPVGPPIGGPLAPTTRPLTARPASSPTPSPTSFPTSPAPPAHQPGTPGVPLPPRPPVDPRPYGGPPSPTAKPKSGTAVVVWIVVAVALGMCLVLGLLAALAETSSTGGF